MPNPHPRPWHKASLFGPGPRRRLDRDQRARFKFLLDAHARANRLPVKQEKVGRALVKRLAVDGRCDPSHATLADDAGCCTRTVQRATERMRDLGLLAWQCRIVRNGWAVRQTSNAYVLALTENPAEIRAIRSGGQTVRQTNSIDKSIEYTSVPPSSDADIALARAALARRRAVIEERLPRKGCAATAGA